MPNKINLLSTIFIIMTILVVISCGRDYNQSQVMREINKMKKSIVPPKTDTNASVFVLQKYEADEAIKLKSPFESNQSMTNTVKSNKPLLNFPLDALRFVGTLSKDNKIQAYVLTPDNKIFMTSVGDIIGSQHAKVVQIDNQQIRILLQEIEPGKPMKQQIITLEIKGGQK